MLLTLLEVLWDGVDEFEFLCELLLVIVEGVEKVGVCDREDELVALACEVLFVTVEEIKGVGVCG